MAGGDGLAPQIAGGILIGDTAGFLNVPKIKGNHLAMKSGMVAADALAEILQTGESSQCTSYPRQLKESWLWKEIYKVRNIRPGFHFGLWVGLINAAFQTFGGWLIPFTLKNHADHAQHRKVANCEPIEYPKPDGVLTFDRLTSVRLSNTMHEENQPSHLKLRDPSIPISVNLPEYAEQDAAGECQFRQGLVAALDNGARPPCNPPPPFQISTNGRMRLESLHFIMR